MKLIFRCPLSAISVELLPGPPTVGLDEVVAWICSGIPAKSLDVRLSTGRVGQKVYSLYIHPMITNTVQPHQVLAYDPQGVPD